MRAVGPDGVARLAERYAGQHGVEPRLVMAIIKVESGFDAKAVSSAGASGSCSSCPARSGIWGCAMRSIPMRTWRAGVALFPIHAGSVRRERFVGSGGV